jgi:hypothetical protein
MERWVTIEEIAAARERFETGNVGYQPPSAHGLIVDGEVAVWNVGNHLLPPAVLCSVIGHDGSTAAIPISPAQLGDAIATLAPAEACTFYDHPNLEAWRHARGSTVVAIFIS